MTEPTPSSSLLNEIISASNWDTHTQEGTTTPVSPIPAENTVPTNQNTPTPNEPPKKKKEPLSPLTLLKWIWSLFLVAVIFFGSFLAYIVFHPEQAQFFVSTFWIDPRDVANILRRLITGSFGMILLILSISWIISLFRAIWTPKDLKRKRILSWITAVFIWIVLFGFIWFWAYLFNIITETDFVNPQGKISVYDSDLAASSATSDYSNITSTNNLIWPINLTFEIWANALQIEKRNLVKINTYEIDFDGAICNDGSSLINGINPTEARGISCLFSAARVYNIKWIYHGTDRLWKNIDIPININPVEIRWVISIKKQKNRNNEDIVTLDASELKNLGNPRWVYKSSGNEVNSSSITEKLLSTPQIIWLKILSDNIDRIFVIENIDEKWFTGSIVANQDPFNPLHYKFNLEWLSINDTDIIWINWSLSNWSIICRWGSLSCDYSFWTYDSYILRARIEMASGEIHLIEKPLKIETPLIVTRRAKVTDTEWNILNTESTFDTKLRAYVIKDLVPPTTILFDARDVVTENLGYQLSSVNWTFSDGKKTEEKEWNQVSYTLSNPYRYTVSIKYTFIPNAGSGKQDEKITQDNIIFDIEHKSLIPRFSLQVPRDYAPVVVTIDWSQSYAENSEIKKFTYDFGDGKPPVSGDAVQKYEYKTPGEKTISLTITNEKGEMETIKKTIVLKDNPKVVDFTPSISPGVVGVPIDFTPTTTEGDISEYIWTFSDNTPAIKDPFPSHTFSDEGKYVVTLTIVYANWTRGESRKEFEVVKELQ